MSRRLTRRDFLKKTTATAATFAAPAVLPGTVFGRRAPSNRVNLAMIGVGVVRDHMTVTAANSYGGDRYTYVVGVNGFGLSTSAGLRLGRGPLQAFAQGRWLVLTTRASYADIVIWSAGVGLGF